MSLFTHRRRVEQLVALGDVRGLRDLLVDAARHSGARADDVCTAASALVDLGEDGVTALVEVILTDPEHVHFGWIEDETFHRAAGPHAVALLSEALLRDPDSDVRLAASGMLRRMETTLAGEAFAAAVADRDPHVRLSAACGLADQGDGRGVRALLEWVAHSDNPVPALRGLARIGDVRLVPVLERLLATSRSAHVARAIEQTITELETARPRPPRPRARLARVRDQLRSIEVVDRATAVAEGPEVQRARQQIPAICDNIEHALAVLRSGTSPDGRPVNKTQVGAGLAALVADVSGPEFDRLMATVLDPHGVRALQDEVADLDRIATDLQERAGQSEWVG
jgi:hypothetical protein